jgi:enamine deaminase RidA (YjgF/YER057c/UK114 family)
VSQRYLGHDTRTYLKVPGRSRSLAPAVRATVGVSRLPRDAKIEIEVIAVR